MNTVLKELLKWWLFKFAKRMATILRKRPERFCGVLHITHSSGGWELTRLPECFHGNKLDRDVRHAGGL